MYSFKVIFCRTLFIYLYKNKQRKVLLKSSIYSFLFSGMKKTKASRPPPNFIYSKTSSSCPGS